MTTARGTANGPKLSEVCPRGTRLTRQGREPVVRRLQCVVHKGPLRRKPLWLQSKLSDVAGGLLPPFLLVALSLTSSRRENIRRMKGGRAESPSFPSLPCSIIPLPSLCPSLRPSLCTFWSSTASRVEAMSVQTRKALVAGNKKQALPGAL